MMIATLFTERTLRRIEEAIEANQKETESVSRDTSPEAGARLAQLNQAWYALEREKELLTGVDPAPYRFRA